MHAEKTILDKFCSRLAKLGIDVFGIAQDEAQWITVHPGGRGRRADGDGQRGGTHVLIDSETGQILGGMGGKHNGKTIAEVKRETKEKKKLSQKQVAAISAKEQQKAYGKGFHDGQKSSFEKGASGALTAQGLAQAAGALAAQKKGLEDDFSEENWEELSAGAKDFLHTDLAKKLDTAIAETEKN